MVEYAAYLPMTDNALVTRTLLISAVAVFGLHLPPGLLGIQALPLLHDGAIGARQHWGLSV